MIRFEAALAFAARLASRPLARASGGDAEPGGIACGLQDADNQSIAARARSNNASAGSGRAEQD